MNEGKKKIEALSNEILDNILSKHETEFTEIKEKASETKLQLRTLIEKI